MWTLNPNHLSNGTLAAPVVVLPDLDGDGARDLAVLAIGELQVCGLLPKALDFVWRVLSTVSTSVRVVLLRVLPRTLFL